MYTRPNLNRYLSVNAMNFSDRCMSPNSVLKSNSKIIVCDSRTSLRAGVLLSYAQKMNLRTNNASESRQAQVLKGCPTLCSPYTSYCKTKSPAVNACYTPSSLFRSANASSTPLSVGRIKKSKQCLANTNHNDGEDRLTVAVRIRPLNAKECVVPSISNIIRVNKNEVTVLVGASADASSGVKHYFAYDHVFSSCDPESSDYAHQKEVFLKTTKPLIIRSFEGYNACLFAYGQTGSGKSYSMMGIDTFDDLGIQEKTLNGCVLNTEAGIIPRFCQEIFQYMKNEKDQFHAELEVSYFEIYNEKIHDLLCVSHDLENNINGKILAGTPNKVRKALKVREHPIWGPYVVDLSVHPVDSFEALRNWLIVGNSQRATAATGLNDKSSRSHSIFNIMLKINYIELTKSNSNESKDTTVLQARRSKISLVDLAGSERISGSNGDRIREGVYINKSLLTLGKVISALSEDRNNNSAVFVPYRESVLTWLLRVCDYELRIRYIQSHSAGSCHDFLIWNVSDLRHYLKQQYEDGERNSWMLGNAGYPLDPYLITPFRTAQEGSSESKFNEIHSTTRNAVERIIGVLKNRFRCLLGARQLHYTPDFAEKITSACAALYNICIHYNIDWPDIYVEEEMNVPDYDDDNCKRRQLTNSFLFIKI